MVRRFVYALAPLTAAGLWGGMYVVSKWGFAAIPPVTLAFLRVVLGAAALIAVVRVRGSNAPAREDLPGFAILGVFVAVTMVTQFVGTDLTNASQGALLTVLTPAFTLVLAVAVLGERVTARKVVGMTLAGVGTLLVLAGQYNLSTLTAANTGGIAALLAASLGWAAYTVWGKPLVRRYSALETAAYSTLAATPMLAALVPLEFAVGRAALSDLSVSPGVVGAVLYLGLASTAAAWYLWYKGLERVDAGTVAVFFFAQPVVGAVLAATLLGERLGPLFVAGGVVMAVGVFLVSAAIERA